MRVWLPGAVADPPRAYVTRSLDHARGGIRPIRAYAGWRGYPLALPCGAPYVVWALGEPAEEADRQTRLCNDNVVGLAAGFADAGFTPVIDWVVPDRAQLDLYVEGLGERHLALVVLDPGGAVCHRRNELRDPEEQFFFGGHEALVASMREAFGELGWWFDTSALTPEESAEQVLAHAYDLGRRGL